MLNKAKSTFSTSNAQRSALWRIADTICQSPVLQLVPVCANFGPNRSVIRWMSAQDKNEEEVIKLNSIIWKTIGIFFLLLSLGIIGYDAGVIVRRMF